MPRATVTSRAIRRALLDKIGECLEGEIVVDGQTVSIKRGTSTCNALSLVMTAEKAEEADFERVGKGTKKRRHGYVVVY